MSASIATETKTPQKDTPIDLQMRRGDPSDSSSMMSPLSSPQLLIENGTTNKENTDNAMLGFTQNLLERIKKSRSLLDAYVKVQRDAADRAINEQADVHATEKEVIGLKIEKLKGIQRRRGLSNLDENCLDNNVLKGDDEDGGGLAQQQSILEKKMSEITRELASVSLEHQKVEKNVKGEIDLVLKSLVLYEHIFFFCGLHVANLFAFTNLHKNQSCERNRRA